MTYKVLLTRIQPSLLVLARGTNSNDALVETDIDYEGAKTTTVRYAVKKNRDRLQEEMGHFQALLEESADEIGCDVEALNQVINDRLRGSDLPPDENLVEAANGLLETKTGFSVYGVSEEDIQDEPNVPIAVLDLIDWMIIDE